MTTLTCHPRTARRLAVWVALLGLGVLAFTSVSPAAPAWAHATLVSSDPRQGQVLAELPETFTLTFNEDMQEPAFVVVEGPDGSPATQGKASVEGARVVQKLTGDAPGTYQLAYRAVSADGHPISGQITFSVGEADDPGSEEAGGSASPDSGTDSNSGRSDDSADSDAGQDPAVGSAAGEPQAEETFWSRHGTHVIVGALLFGLAGALLVVSRRSAR